MSETAMMDVSADKGALILGGLFAFGLSGCVIVQFIMYWRIYPKERWTTKFLVIATWILDLSHSAFVAVAIWDSAVSSYGDLNRIDVIPWSVGPTVQLTALVTFLVQRRVFPGLLATLFVDRFFAYRIYRFQSRKQMVAGIVVTLSIIQLVAASVSTVEMISLKLYSEFASQIPSWVFALGLALSAFVDIVIAVSLCYLLRSNRSLLPSTNRTIGILTLWTVQNGSITCSGAIASLVCWLVMPQNRIFLGVHFVVGKLYANSLLATINARNRIRRARKYHTTSQMPPIPILPESLLFAAEDRTISPRNPQPCVKRLDPWSLQRVDLTRTRSIEVNIQRTVEAKYDDGDVDVDVLSVTAESAREAEGFESVSEA